MGRTRTIDDARIISAARWLFLLHGPRATTRDIANDVGIAESALYKRFGTKEELFFAAMTPKPVAVDEILGPRSGVRAIADPEQARKWLHGVARALVLLCAELLPSQWLVLAGTAPDADVYRRWWRADPCSVIEGELADRLTILGDHGHITVLDPAAAARLVVAAARDTVFREAMLPASYPSPERIERGIDETFEQLWLGIASRRRVAGWMG